MLFAFLQPHAVVSYFLLILEPVVPANVFEVDPVRFAEALISFNPLSKFAPLFFIVVLLVEDFVG